MGTHMKTTIEIADDLFQRAQMLARERRITFRALTEQGLRLALRDQENAPGKLPRLVTVRGRGLSDGFKSASWDQVRDEIYRGRGS